MVDRRADASVWGQKAGSNYPILVRSYKSLLRSYKRSVGEGSVNRTYGFCVGAPAANLQQRGYTTTKISFMLATPRTEA
jgi:hypothetical protein